MKITVQKTASPKAKPADSSSLGFGKIFTDHMLLMDYDPGSGWHSPRILPYGPLELDPATSSLHYGQLIFEGMKAYKSAQGKTVMFRPQQNMSRLNESAKRICIPAIDEDLTLDAITQLVKLEEDWIPSEPGTSLYIRPFILGTDNYLGVRPSDKYLFCTILSPSGLYFKGSVSIHVEESCVRAVQGGTGFAKCAGNYAASMLSQMQAQAQGFSQVLWLDAAERKYIEEVGAMNIFFVIDGQVVTPELSGTILHGITRDSVLKLLKSWGMPASERKISIQEVADASKAGKLDEAFGAGTAAIISPVGGLKWRDELIKIGNGTPGPVAQKLYDNLIGIQTCRLPDPFGWVYEVN